MRVEAMLAVGVPGAPDVAEWTQRGPTTDREAMLQIRAVKAYYDGSLGSRGAKLLDDYADQPGHRGIAGADYGFDPEAVEAFMAAGFQAGIHAIGDAGNRDVLDFYEAVFSRQPDARVLRHRVEHAQVVHPDDIARFGALGLVASMEPGHAVEDSPWAEDRLGPDRVRGAYAWRSLRQGGALLIFNSDFTGTDWSPFYGFYAATTRRMKDGTPADGWIPEEAVTAEEALRAYTVWPARASGIEDRTGTLAPGKWADLTVLDLDPLNTPSDSLLSGFVRMTVVGGVVRFDATDG
jgi:predicted amidohydrolase YtcJ